MANKISNKQLRDFGYLFGFAFPLIFGWLIPSFSGHSFREWTLFISTPLLLLAIFSPKLLRKPYLFWMKLGYFLGFVNSKIILGIVFIIVLLPISLLMKVFGYDPLHVKKSNLDSYKENKKGSNVDLTRIF